MEGTKKQKTAVSTFLSWKSDNVFFTSPSQHWFPPYTHSSSLCKIYFFVYPSSLCCSTFFSFISLLSLPLFYFINYTFSSPYALAVPWAPMMPLCAVTPVQRTFHIQHSLMVAAVCMMNTSGFSWLIILKRFFSPQMCISPTEVQFSMVSKQILNN